MVFYTGCNVLKTPHIALLCLDIMDVIGTDYQVMGGPTHCCGTAQLRAGDIDTLGPLRQQHHQQAVPVEDRGRCWRGARAA